MAEQRNRQPTTLSELPTDELVRYGRQLGLQLRPSCPRGELLRRIRQRQELILQLDREAMLDVVVWARRPVHPSASREELVHHIVQVESGDYEGLSQRGLVVLARLRGLTVGEDEPKERIIRRLRRADGPWRRLGRAARALLLRRRLERAEPDQPVYRFLPEPASDEARQSGADRRTNTNRGIVGGIAGKIRGVADDYIREKLDEIEARIDRKLDEIDRRLCEWRDREVANRLKIIKITLIASVLVALLSLGYKYAQHRFADVFSGGARSAQTQ